MKLFGHRQTIRLNNYNYSNSGLYFITICTQNRECLFGNIINNKMVLNNVGIMIENLWNKIPKRFDTAQLDTFQIMPNHIHGIIAIVGAGFMPALNLKFIKPTNDLFYDKRATTRVAPTIGDIIGVFKSLTTYEYIDGVKKTDGHHLIYDYGNVIIMNI